MKIVGGYLKKNYKWFLLLGCSMVLFMIVMAWNQVAFEETLYGIVLVLVLTILVMIGDFYRYYRKSKNLERILPNVEVSLDELLEAEDLIEEQYQLLLQEMQKKRLKRMSELDQQQEDTMNYFSTWVHQIKTPIAAMHVLLQEQKSVIESADLLGQNRQMEQQLFEMEQYVEMTLQYIHLGADATDYVIKEQSLDAIIRQVIRKYSRTFIGKGITLEYEGTTERVITDEKWMVFVIEQILSNALKYTSQGKITIKVTPGTKIEITDTGIGIAPEDLPRVFEKGYTGYNGHEDKRSTGIGLYLCKQTLKRLSHEIRIESRLGEGTRVIIEIL